MRVLGQCALHLRVNVAGNHEEVWKPIVIEVDDSCSPTHVTGFHTKTRGPRGVLKVALPIVVIKDVSVVRKMCFEDVKMPVQIVIADPHPHTRLLHTIVAQRHAAYDSFFAKSPIMIVHKKKTGSGVTGDVDILPSVFIKIRRNHSHAVSGRDS